MKSIQRILNVRPEEGARVALLGLGWALITAFAIAGKAARDAFFLSRYDKSYLPLMVVAIAFAVTAVVALLSKLSRRLKPRQILALTGTIVTVSLLLLGSKLEGWLIPALYVWIELATVILGLQFWMMAAELVDSRQAKRLFGLIAGGGSLAAILVGSQLRLFVKTFGSGGLLPMVAAFALGAAAVGLVAGRFAPAAPAIAPARRKEAAPVRKFDGYLTAIAIIVCAAAVASTLVDYQFKIVASSAFQSEGDLIAFFGMFSAIAGASSLLMQIFLTGRILSRLGTVTGLAILPTGLSVSSGFVLLTPVLAVASLAKFFDQTLKFTVHNSGLECLWFPVPPAQRQAVKPWITATLKSSAEGLSGLATFFLVKIVSLSTLSVLVLAACAVWIYTLVRLRDLYSRTLEKALRNRGIEHSEVVLDAQDAAVIRTLEQPLASGDAVEQLFALGLMDRMPLRPWASSLQRLVRQGSAEVRKKILEIAADDSKTIPDGIILEAVTASGPVAEAAIRVAVRRSLTGLPSLLAGRLADLHPGTRAAAAAALYRLGQQREKAQSVLAQMLVADDQAQRAVAIRELTDLPALLPEERLVELLQSPSTAVREAVLSVAGGRGAVKLIPALIDRLSDHSIGMAVRQTLLQFPAETVLEEMTARLLQEVLTTEDRMAQVKMLRYLPPDRASVVLCSQLLIDDPPVRHSVPESLLVVCRKAHPSVEVLKEVESRQLDWTRAAYAASESLRLLPPRNTAILLSDHFENAFRQSLSGLFKLLALRRPTVPVEKCLDIVLTGDKARLAFVLDLLDSFLSVTERKRVSPLFEASPEERGAIGRHFFSDLPGTLDEVLARTVRSPRDWDQAIAFDYLLRHGDPRPYIAGRTAPKAGPLTAEVLAYGLRRQPGVLLDARRDLLISLPERTESMYSTLEKTIILKTASLFSEIAAQTLSRVAQCSEEEAFPAGTVVYREGDPGSAIYVVASGSVRLAVRGIELGVLRRGDPFGEVAVLNRDVYRAEATAMEDTVLLRIDQEDLFDLMQADAEIMKGIVGLLAKRVVQVGSNLLDRVAGAQNGPK